MRQNLLRNQGVRGFGLIHTQEVRGSSPCAPAIHINELRSGRPIKGVLPPQAWVGGSCAAARRQLKEFIERPDT
jgi:hypothetical protein